MRASIFIALTTLLFMPCAARAQTAVAEGSWVEVAPRGESFTASMPARPSARPQQARTDALSARGRLHSLSGPDSVTYAVWSLAGRKLPGGQIADTSDYLDACAVLAWDLIVKPEEARARREGPRRPGESYQMSYGREVSAASLVETGSGRAEKFGYQAREYDIEAGDRRGRAHIFADGRQLYIVAAFGPARGEAQVDTFLNSFAVKLPRRAGVLRMPRRADKGYNIGGGVGPGIGAGVGPGIGTGVGPGRGENTGTGGGVGSGVGPRANPVRAPGEPCANEAGRVFTQREVTRKAVLTYKPEPGFTEQARKFSVVGAVRVRAVLTGDGKVSDISLVRGLPHGLSRRVVEAARRIQFQPAELHGCKVAQRITIEYTFNIY